MTHAKQGSTSLAAPPPSRADIESLKRFYVFREPTEVLEFLEKHPFLVPLLLEAPARIRQYFPDSPLFLQYVPDPESDDEKLVAYIATNLAPEEAIDTLEQFDDNWWVDVEERAQDKMFFNLHRIANEV